MQTGTTSRPLTFSVVIPVYNRAPLIRATLDSVLDQPTSGIDVIVVDDGSTDGSLEILESYGSRITVLRQQNRGPGSARNLGAKHAHGEYLAFLDSDDLWFSWTARTYAEAIERTGRPSFVAGAPHVFRTALEQAAAREAPLQYLVFPDYLDSYDEWRWFSASSFVVRRDVFEQVGGFPEGTPTEDVDLTLRLGTAANFVQIKTPATFAYREHNTSLKANLRSYLVEGQHCVIASEERGLYPGGAARKRQRRVIISRHARPVTVECVHAGQMLDGWKLYLKLAPWHLSLGRWKYLVGFPAYAVTRRLRRKRHA